MKDLQHIPAWIIKMDEERGGTGQAAFTDPLAPTRAAEVSLAGLPSPFTKEMAWQG